MNRQHSTQMRNILWLVFYSALFLFAIVFDTMSAWLPFYFFTFFIAVNTFVFIQNFKNLKVLSEQIYIDETKTGFIMTIKNSKPSFFPRLQLELNVDGQTISSQALFGIFKSDILCSFHAQTLGRGLYPIKTINLIIGDGFGVFSKTIPLKVDSNLCVLPKPKTEEALAIYHYLNSRNQLSSSDYLSFDIKKIRDYHYGDRLNLIDWKLSSKKQALIVKEYDEEKGDDLQFVFFGEKSQEFEPILSVFYSFYSDYLTSFTPSVTLIGADTIDAQPDALSFSKITAIEEDSDLILRVRSALKPNHRKIIFSTLPSPQLNHVLLNDEAFKDSWVFQREIDGKLIVGHQGKIDKVPLYRNEGEIE